MSKDFKDKYERVCSIKDKAISLVETQLNGNIENVDAEELGEVADIAKDMAELMKLCAEAEYYHKVTEAMDESSDEEKKHYMNKYIPEYEGKFYTPIEYARQRDSRGRYMYTEPYDNDDWDKAYSRMYYTNYATNTSGSGGRSSSNGGSSSMSGYARDYREGRSPMVRRTYMEMKENGEDKNKTNKELENYMTELSEDMTEMIQNMDANEKAILKQKMNGLIAKIQ